MHRNRYLLIILALGLAVAWLATPVSAFEMTMKGKFTWETKYVTQGGRAGFFGPHEVDASGGANQHLNFYPGYKFFDRVVSGLDAGWNSQYMTTDISIKINPAVSLRGTYYIGSWDNRNGAAAQFLTGTTVNNNNPGWQEAYFGVPGWVAASEYISNGLEGVQRSFSPGYWNTLSLRAQLPWGTLAVGKRPSRFGCGMQWNGDENTSSESCSLTVPYGPMRMGFSFYPSRVGDDGYYNRDVDWTNKRDYDFTGSVLYLAGNFETGVQMTKASRHRGSERQIAAGATAQTRDRADFYGGFYTKYNNGRFFLSAEYDFFNRIDRLAGVNRAGVFQAETYRDREYRAWMVEAGVYSGNSKLTLLASRVSGREGRTVNADYKNNINPSGNLTNTGVFLPYSLVMVYTYAAGDGSPTVGAGFNPFALSSGGGSLYTGNGQLTGAMLYAARFDYAIAANLNIFGTYAYAVRPDKGYGWGYSQLIPNGVANAGLIRYVRTVRQAAAGNSPAIPDDFLGWEVDAGFSWQLLEGLTFNLTAGYWQPGDWFKFACVSKSNPGWTAPAPGNFWGTQPDRSIDPVTMAVFNVTAEF